MMNDLFVVICRDDADSAGNPGAYVLATRRVFATAEAATAYASTVATSREAMVVSGWWQDLHLPG